MKEAMQRIERLLSWAVPATGDEESRQRGRLLFAIVGVALALSLLDLGVLLNWGRGAVLAEHRAFIPMLLALLLVFLLCVLFLRLGRVRLAGMLYLMDLQAMVAWTAVLAGAPLWEALIFFIPVVVIAFLLLGARASLLFAGFSASLLAALGWANAQGWITAPAPGSAARRIAALIGHSNLTVVVILALVLLAGQLERALREAGQRNRELLLLNQELARLKAFNERIVQTLEEGIAVIDAQGALTFVNPRLADMLGYTQAELIGRHLCDLADQVVAAGSRALVEAQHAQRPQGISGRYEALLYTRDGRELPVLIAATPLFEEGRYVGTLAALTDISARVRLEALQREFIAVASHDLRSPLQSIVGYLDLVLTDEDMDAATQREFIQIARNESERLIHLANSVLDLTRLQAGQMPLNLAPVDVRPLIEQATSEVWPLAQRKRIALLTETAPDLPLARADAEGFSRILRNLLTNAVKFTPEGGTVRLVAAGQSDHVLIQVCDNGPGIPAEELPRIFERFYRGANARDRLGAGLGLAIARQLVEAQGGRIWAESTPGQGSVFSFTLPAAAPVTEGEVSYP
jgi:PAS domain S-box-containing protein